MSSSTILASPPRRHHLSPVKPMKSNRLRGANSLNRNSCVAPSPTATKRSHCDENCNPSPAFTASSPHKRVKSGLSPALNAVLKSAISTVPVAKPQKRAFGTLVDVTNTRANAVHAKGRAGHGVLVGRGSASKSTFGKPTRTILKPVTPKKSSPKPTKEASPSHRAAARVRAPSPRLGSGRGIKRSYNLPAFKRVDPPSSQFSASSSPTSIDSLLAAVSRPKSSLFALPPKAEARKDDWSPLIAANIPGSWVFDIYEDSPEEMLQNLMEHSTHTLDISDDSDDGSDTSELQERGKENISPARLAELLAIAPVERSNAMRVDVAEKLIPQRRAYGSRRDFSGRREALREMQREELLLPEPEKKEAPPAPAPIAQVVNKLPTLGNESFFEFKTSRKPEEEEPEEVASTPKSPGSPGWVVWESDHESSEDEVAVAAKVPLPPSELDFDLEQPGFEVDAASLYGASDQE